MKNLPLLPILLASLLTSTGAFAQSSITNGDFSSGSTGWTIENAQTNSTFTTTDGIATIVDSGDPTDPASRQVLYQDFAPLSGEVDFSYDFRINTDFTGDNLRIELYTGAYEAGNVFRMILNPDDGTDRNFRVNIAGTDAFIDLNPTPGADAWISVAGAVDLVNDTTSGTITSPDGLTTYGSWSGDIDNTDATTISGFAFYDTNTNTVGTSISLDNVSVSAAAQDTALGSYEVVTGSDGYAWVDTGEWLSWVLVEYEPYVYILSLNAWAYSTPISDESVGSWFYVFSE